MEVRKMKIILAVLVIGTVAPVTFMALDNKWPYEYHGGELHPDPAKPGDEASVFWRVKINRVCLGYISRQIIDSRGYVHTADPVPALGNVATNFWVTFRLPSFAAKGPATYRAHGTYWCNPLQRLFPLKTVTPDVKFTIG